MPPKRRSYPTKFWYPREHPPTTLPLQPVEHRGRPVRDNYCRTGSEIALERLERHVFQREHACLGTRMDHGELPADLVRGYGQVAPDLLGVANDV